MLALVVVVVWSEIRNSFMPELMLPWKHSSYWTQTLYRLCHNSVYAASSHNITYMCDSVLCHWPVSTAQVYPYITTPQLWTIVSEFPPWCHSCLSSICSFPWTHDLWPTYWQCISETTTAVIKMLSYLFKLLTVTKLTARNPCNSPFQRQLSYDAYYTTETETA